MPTWGDLVGRKLKGYSGRAHAPATYTIESYARSHGFWIVNEVDPTERHDISERAIGRTFFLVPEK